MDTQNQNDQQQEKQSGDLSQGINALNNFKGLKNSFGRGSLKFAAQAGKLATQMAAKGAMALFTTPAGWVILGITAVVVFTFVIIFSLGAPPASPNPQTPNQTQSTLAPPAAP